MAQFEFIDLEGLGKFKEESDKIYANKISISQNSTTGVVTFQLYSKDNTLLDTKTLDLDTEHIIKSVSLDYNNKLLIFTMNDDSTIECDISDLIDGLSSDIQNVASDLASEITNRQNADTSLGNRITAIENDYLTSSDKTELEGAINDEEIRAKGVEDSINAKIPSEASAQNQLADKSWVNDNGGKIDTISINGTNIPADANKNVDLPSYPTRQSLSINNVDNTSDANKPVSTAQQTAIDSTGHKIDLEIDSTNYKVVAKLYDKNNTLISTSNEIDLPLESVVVSGSYDSLTKEVVLTLQNGSSIRFSVADLVSGLQTQIDSNHKLSSDLVDDTLNTNRFVTSAEKIQITNNATDISNMKDGTNIDSFGDVETALYTKVDKTSVGVITISTASGTLTPAQYSELQKDIAIIKYGNITLYKEDLEDGANSNTLVFASKIKTSTISGTYVQISQDIVSIDTTSLAYTYTENAIINTYNKTQMDSLLSDKQDTISDLATIRSGASAGATAVQDASYVHTDNNYTTNEKNKLDGIEDGAEVNDVNSVNGKTGVVVLDSDDIDDTNASNKFVSATEKSNISKALYHKGAYDSADGKTRQTGYTDLGSLSWSYNSTNSVFYTKLSTLKTSMYLDEVKSIKCPIYTTYNGSTLSSMSDLSITATYIGSNQDIAIKDTSCNGDVNTLLAKVNGVYIEYLQATSYYYTDDGIIENESILPLDSNMANKIRQKVVDGLNLFDFITANPNYDRAGELNGSDNINNNGTITIGVDARTNYGKGFKIPIIKNTHYTFSFDKSIADRVYVEAFQNNISIAVNSFATSGRLIFHFTTNNSSDFVIIGFSADTAVGTLTISNLMLNEGNNTYPYSDFNQKEHITNDEATLLKQEEEKCRNLFDEQWEQGFIATDGTFGSSSNCIRSMNYITVKPNSNYTLSAPKGQFRIAYYTNNQTFISTLTGNQNQAMSITTPSNCYYIKFCSLPDITPYYGGTYTNDIMLNEGSEAKPYQPYYGEIVHKADIEPVLLWENSSPTSAFNPQNISVNSMADYKFIVVGFKRTNSSSINIQYTKVKKVYGKYSFTDFADDNSSASAYQENVTHRSFQLVNDTTVQFYAGFINNETNNDVNIPVEIYGTNVL